jgi:penicillin-binding protein 1C
MILSLGLVAGNAFAEGLPSYDEVKNAHNPSDIHILDRHGELIHRLRTDRNVRRGQWISLDAVSPAFRQAIVLSEDKRFYEHSGVDWRAASAAAWGNLWNQKTRGASTLTMQLVGLLNDDLKSKKTGRTLTKKIEQSITAEWLELHWRKDQILEAYLNLVPFRGETVGIDALSQTLFSKAAQGLNNQDAAIAAALVRGPNAAPSEVTRRACNVLRLIETNASTATCDGLDHSVAQALQRRAFEPSAGIAPQVARHSVAQWRKSRESGLERTQETSHSVNTTIDASVQRFAVQTLQSHLRELRTRHVQDGGIIVLDNHSGDILAWVGSSSALSKAENVDTVLALRQPGSTLKPFLYAQAIAEQRLTAASLLDDSSAQLQTGTGLYIPQNYDHTFKGWVSVRTALAASLNLPAVRTLMMVTPEAFAQQLKRVGLPLAHSGDFYGYSLALGSAEVSLLNLSNAYRTLANAGQYTPLTQLLRPSRAELSRNQSASVGLEDYALDPRAAFIVSNILSDPDARASTFGTDSVLTTRFWSAVKTGTSKDMRDNWALGYSARYTVGVWVGNANGTPMWNISGTTGAAPIWAAVIEFMHRDRTDLAPTMPVGIVKQSVEFIGLEDGGFEAPRSEWFLSGTEQTQIALKLSAPIGSFLMQQDAALNQTLGARIISPTNGTIIALDPDIPAQSQKIALKAEHFGNQQPLRWAISGQPLPGGDSATWQPQPGQHDIVLMNHNGVTLDKIKIDVRGAQLKRTDEVGIKP